MESHCYSSVHRLTAQFMAQCCVHETYRKKCRRRTVRLSCKYTVKLLNTYSGVQRCNVIELDRWRVIGSSGMYRPTDVRRSSSGAMRLPFELITFIRPYFEFQVDVLYIAHRQTHRTVDILSLGCRGLTLFGASTFRGELYKGLKCDSKRDNKDTIGI
jgi:hypothetical protein